MGRWEMGEQVSDVARESEREKGRKRRTEMEAICTAVMSESGYSSSPAIRPPCTGRGSATSSKSASTDRRTELNSPRTSSLLP